MTINITNEELARLYQETGDISYQEALINQTRGLVNNIANNYCDVISSMSAIDLDDLKQSGTIGVIEALSKFDYSLGYKFSTFAYSYIDKNIKDCINQTGRTIRLPEKIIYNQVFINKTRNELTSRFGYEPSIDELALATGNSISQIYRLNNLDSCSSLNYVIDDESDTTFEDTLCDDSYSVADIVEGNILYDEALKHIERLPANVQYIFKAANGIDCESKTIDELSRELGLSSANIKTIHNLVKDNLQKAMAA